MPDATKTPHLTHRDLTWSDALTGAKIAIGATRTIDGILDLLEARVGSGPIRGQEFQTIEAFVESAVMLCREALASIECGAGQALDNMRELQAAEHLP